MGQANDYDSDSLQADIETIDDEKESYLFNKLCLITDQNVMQTMTVYNLIKHQMIDPVHKHNYKQFEDVLAKRIFNAIHSYLVHSETELFRLKKNMNEINERFASAVKEQKESKEDEDVYQIDFGRSVLIWLKYGEHGTFDTFKQEIISNPASTINAKLYKEYEIECKLLCQQKKFLQITIKEMISLKLYTNTTEYQSALRRAFWSNSTKQERRNFFQWAITLYIAFQRYSKPIIRFSKSEENERPAKLYHGLNNTFAIDSGLPFYFGIISLTSSINTANKFANGTGLLWYILTSYTNKFRAVIGISTDWFSSFKNEAEIISFNTILPIQKTKNFSQSDD